MEGLDDFTISYKPVDSRGPRKATYKKAETSLVTYPSRKERELTIFPCEENETFNFLKKHSKDYLVNPYVLNTIPNETGVDVHMLVEDVIPYDAWFELFKSKMKYQKKNRWENAKIYLGAFFRELMQSMLKAHEDGFKVHDRTDIVVYVEKEGDYDHIVKKCKFTYLDIANGGPYVDDMKWFWEKVDTFLKGSGCFSAAPQHLKDFISAPAHNFETDRAMDCPYFWKSSRKADFICQLAACIIEGRLDRRILAQAMQRQQLSGWYRTMTTEDIKTNYGRFYTILTTKSKLGETPQLCPHAKYNGTWDLVVFCRDVLSHYSDRVGSAVQVVKERDEVLDDLEAIFEDLVFKLWVSLGDYFQHKKNIKPYNY